MHLILAQVQQIATSQVLKDEKVKLPSSRCETQSVSLLLSTSYCPVSHHAVGPSHSSERGFLLISLGDVESSKQ